ncbi:MAG: HAD family hydrolase [Pseudomonadota bacterium]
MQKPAVLFDLGNTLVSYYRKEEFTPVLELCITNVIQELQRMEVGGIKPEAALAAALQENQEARDHHFSPLWPRLARIFRMPLHGSPALFDTMCTVFMQPIFATANVYEDTIPVLQSLKEAGFKTAIVSNSPWGSSPALWRAELHRLGLLQLVDKVILCGDVGWRKPAPQIFRHAAKSLGEPCENCLFVGDDPEWDVYGSSAVGMQSLLLDRTNFHDEWYGDKLRNLDELAERLLGPVP